MSTSDGDSYYFAAKVLNVSYAWQKELGDESNKLTELFSLFMLSFPKHRSEEIRVGLLETAKSLRKHLDDIVPFSLISDKLDLKAIDILLSEDCLHAMAQDEYYFRLFYNIFNNLCTPVQSTGRIQDFHPLETCATGRTKPKRTQSEPRLRLLGLPYLLAPIEWGE